MDNGETVSAERDHHPHTIAEAIRWQICEGEVVQAIGRGRGINRSTDTPLDVIVMTDVILPMKVTRLLTATDLDPSPRERMLAAGGVAFDNPTHASRAYPQIWKSGNCASTAFTRDAKRGRNDHRGVLHSPIESVLIGECSTPLHRLVYRVASAGQKDAEAWFDPAMVSNPADTIRALLRVELVGWMITPGDDHTTEDQGIDHTAVYPPAGHQGQRVMVVPTDWVTIRIPSGTLTTRRFDGVTNPVRAVTEPAH
jgi:hypothetical protein